MIPIVQKENPLLRKSAAEVPLEHIKTKKVRVILEQMREALKSQEDGVAIAAPQIGQSFRIFLVSRSILGTKTKPAEKDLICINPKITKLSKKKVPMEEGCLSVRWLYGSVARSDKATVRAYDESGKAFTRGASGVLAQVFQHECDHLNGVLFIDKATNLHEIPPPHKRGAGTEARIKKEEQAL